MASDKHTDVFQREFPICDVAQGLIRDPSFLSKGNPLSESVIYKNSRILYLSMNFDLVFRVLSYPRIPFFIFRGFPSNDVAQGLIGKLKT